MSGPADPDRRDPDRPFVSGNSFHGPAFVQAGAHGRQEIHLTAAPRPPVEWPVRVGTVPALASAFQPRDGIRRLMDEAWRADPHGVRTQVLVGGAGCGKTQLAAAYAHSALLDAQAELVVWANAATVDHVIAQYAEAADRVQAPGRPGERIEDDARAFLDWLATTPRRWLVVLDDVSDPAGMGPWWPPASSGTGRTLATARRREALLSGGARGIVEVGEYTRPEALGYLTERLGGAGRPDLADGTAEELCGELGRLPLAVSYAAAYLINEDVTCAEYLARLLDRRSRLDELLPADADAEGYGRRAATTALLLSLDAAQRAAPAGLALPALQLAAHLDPAGHPAELWRTPAVAHYLTGQPPAPVDGVPTAGAPPAGAAPDASAGRAALRVLHRYALVNCAPQDGPRAVRIHALTARSARENLPAADPDTLVLAAADALVALWPTGEPSAVEQAPTVAVLQANAEVLSDRSGERLWAPPAHGLLMKTGESLLHRGRYDRAAAHWQRLAADAERLRGPVDPHTLGARAFLADSLDYGGRNDEAVRLREQIVEDCVRLLGPDDLHTLGARVRLGLLYWRHHRLDDAYGVEWDLVRDCERLFGPDDLRTLQARQNLASTMWALGSGPEAVQTMREVLAAYERELGPTDTTTVNCSVALAGMDVAGGRARRALPALERAVDLYTERLGAAHPRTLTVRDRLADAYANAGRKRKYLSLMEAIAEDTARAFGPDHPNTLVARHNLGLAHRKAGRAAKAVALLEAVVADFELYLGYHHPSTYTARANLARAYAEAGRTTEAAMEEMRIQALYRLRDQMRAERMRAEEEGE
ncbi:tetratricopeptide repeat protein [Streptomyces sp. NPDC101206]|uniref:tetratricopeptide repeat protein n=1 Tax=Streptomyces sp. NPDC101206 TaxID=3366128 RepID=UPI00382EA718